MRIDGVKDTGQCLSLLPCRTVQLTRKVLWVVEVQAGGRAIRAFVIGIVRTRVQVPYVALRSVVEVATGRN